MKLIREYEYESLETICHILPSPEQANEEMAMDEHNLAWMFVAHDYREGPCCEKLLKWAYGLLGDDAWMVLQTSGALSEGLLTQFDLDVIEDYRSESNYTHAIDLLLVRKAG